MGGPLTKWAWRRRGRFVMTFSDVFLFVPFLASPFDLHRFFAPNFEVSLRNLGLPWGVSQL